MSRPLHSWLIVLFLSALLIPVVSAQDAQANRNLIRNPGFEGATSRIINPWYGTDPNGMLQLPSGQLPVLRQQGGIGNVNMPVSVSVGDLNGNGLQDILAASTAGYMMVFFNSGTPEEPKFTRAELLPVNLSRPRIHEETYEWNFRYHGPRVHLADITGRGNLDIWMGNYFGEVFRIPNSGTPQSPDFRMPRGNDALQYLIPTSKDPDRRWGNVFAPALWDFDGDGRMDLLVGEGSYSANSIHILLNRGSNASPVFEDTNRHFLAFGMGREQLTPAVVDFNGNGSPDLLVTDRSGQIGLYSSSISPVGAEAAADQIAEGGGIQAARGGSWQPGQHLPFVSYLSTEGLTGNPLRFGSVGREGSINTVATGDLTGNGLFDLVVGKDNGRIAFVKNTGTKQEPKFAAPVELKGEPSATLQLPSQWLIEYGDQKANYFGFADVVDADSDPKANIPEGKKALKFGYMPNLNRYVRSTFVWSGPLEGSPPDGGHPFGLRRGRGLGSNVFALGQGASRSRQGGIEIQHNQTYVLSFRVRGERVSSSYGQIRYFGSKRLGEDKITKLGRGDAVKVDRNVVEEGKRENFTFPVTPNWTQVRREFRARFDDRELADIATAQMGFFLAFELTPGEGVVYLDDFSLQLR